MNLVVHKDSIITELREELRSKRRYHTRETKRLDTALVAAAAPALPGHPLALFLAGCALVGLGVANMVPVLFSAAGRMPNMAPSAAIAAAATPGYAGLLAGPVAVGWIAQATTLPLAFAGLAVLAAIVGLSARIVRG